MKLNHEALEMNQIRLLPLFFINENSQTQGPLSSKERGKRGLGGKGGEVQENNEKLTIDNTESTIFRAAELYYPRIP